MLTGTGFLFELVQKGWKWLLVMLEQSTYTQWLKCTLKMINYIYIYNQLKRKRLEREVEIGYQNQVLAELTSSQVHPVLHVFQNLPALSYLSRYRLGFQILKSRGLTET